MDTFKDLTPEEIKLTTLQFIGQNLLGSLKELDSSIVSRNQTLQGKTLDAVNVIKNIPGSNPFATTVNAGINVNRPPASQQPVIIQHPQVQHNPDQLEFDFEKKARYEDIHTLLLDIKSILTKIDKKINGD